MKHKIKSIALVYLFMLCHILSAQESLKQYEFGFDFVEGIYLTFEEFKNNDPAIKENKVVAIYQPTDQIKYIDYSKKKIKYTDPEREVRKIHIKDIWGVCNNDIIYIELGNRLHKLVKIGAISYLIELHNGPVRSHRVIGAVGYAPGESRNIIGNLNRIFDFQTGDVVPLTPDNLAKLLSADTALFTGYLGLTAEDRKKHMLQYLDKFNERNPIYFPIDHQKAFDTKHAVEVKFD
jgi:hypothetical protein